MYMTQREWVPNRGHSLRAGNVTWFALHGEGYLHL